MRATLRLELIGDNYLQHARLIRQGKAEEPKQLRDYIALIRYGQKRFRPWVAKLTGTDKVFGFSRAFVKPMLDFSEANGIGSRGIFAYYALEPGLYEVNECAKLGKARRYFICVENEQISEIPRDEVVRCLTSGSSESAS